MALAHVEHIMTARNITVPAVITATILMLVVKLFPTALTPLGLAAVVNVYLVITGTVKMIIHYAQQQIVIPVHAQLEVVTFIPLVKKGPAVLANIVPTRIQLVKM